MNILITEIHDSRGCVHRRGSGVHADTLEIDCLRAIRGVVLDRQRARHRPRRLRREKKADQASAIGEDGVGAIVRFLKGAGYRDVIDLQVDGPRVRELDLFRAALRTDQL